MGLGRTVALLIAAFIMLRTGWLWSHDLTALWAIGITLLGIILLIWFGSFIAMYILPFGWRSSQAHDHHRSDQQGAVVRLLGWICLLILLLMVMFVAE